MRTPYRAVIVASLAMSGMPATVAASRSANIWSSTQLGALTQDVEGLVLAGIRRIEKLLDLRDCRHQSLD
jgi:hypothetical protein